MILIQLSSGQGPIECSKAVGLAIDALTEECRLKNINCKLLEAVEAQHKGCFKSALLQLDSNDKPLAEEVATSWQGAMLWVCQSRYRPKHKRKNWFFSGRMFEIDEAKFGSHITFQTCRASGAGGQHVNKTDSAVKATHRETGLSVRVESERSQHANKRVAIALLHQRLNSLKQQKVEAEEQQRWRQHWELERGNPSKTFKGEKFVLVG